MEFSIEDIEVDIIVVQLVEDVERRKIGHIILIGIQYARGIAGIRIRIDIEVAFHLAANNVYVLSQRSGGALLAIDCSADEVER